MSHGSLDCTACPFSTQVGSAAQVHMAGQLSPITIPDGPACAESGNDHAGVGNEEGVCQKPPNTVLGQGNGLNQACRGTHLQLWLRPQQQPLAVSSEILVVQRAPLSL